MPGGLGGARGDPRSRSRQAGQQVGTVAAFDDQIAGFGEAVRVVDPGQALDQPFRRARVELSRGQAPENGAFPGRGFFEALRESFRSAGVMGLPTVEAELRVVVGGGAFLFPEPPAHAGQIGQGAGADAQPSSVDYATVGSRRVARSPGNRGNAAGGPGESLVSGGNRRIHAPGRLQWGAR